MLQTEKSTDPDAKEQPKVNEMQLISAHPDDGEGLAEIAHDARNMVTALDLYCDLLQEPGVLAASFANYGTELRLVAAASRRLVEKLGSIQPHRSPANIEIDDVSWPASAQTLRTEEWKGISAKPISNLAEELFANRSLLAALAGSTIAVTLDARGGAVPVRLTSEDLTRILVNLLKNSAEAMSASGRIHISLEESRGADNTPWVKLSVEDNGPGLAAEIVDQIFESKHIRSSSKYVFASAEWPPPEHGLGLPIIRSIVEAAGGAVHAANRASGGACFQIELPVRQCTDCPDA